MKDLFLFFGKALLYLFVWGLFVAVVTTIDKNTLNTTPIWANCLIVLIVFFIPFWLSKFIWRKGQKVQEMITKHASNIQISQETVRDVNSSMSVYNKTRGGLKDITDDVLLTKYPKVKGHIEDEMILLALEDELVERKLITYSPMRRKIDALMTKFNP